MGKDQATHGKRRNLRYSPSSPVATYQTRIRDYEGMERSAGDAALSADAELYGRVERKVFAQVAAGRSAASLKSGYLKRYGIPGRMFNSIRVSLEGKIASVKEQQKLRVDGLRGQIGRAETQIGLAEEQGRLVQAHHKRRRLTNLQSRLASLETDVSDGRVRLCFGSRKLGHKQHNLKSNGYASHQAWLAGCSQR